MEDPGSHSPRAKAGVGDVNGDGYDDLIYETRDPGGEHHGAVMFGGPDGPDPSLTINSIHIQHPQATPVGDLDNDGYDDLVAFPGKYRSGGALPGQPDIDRAYIMYGGPNGPDLDDLSHYVRPSTMGGDRAMLRTATSGDFNGDGYLELVVGGWEGALWADVPEVFNGDGYDDLAVAVPTLTYKNNADTNRGAIYHGQYVSCVAQVANGARDAELLSGKESAAIKRSAAKNK